MNALLITIFIITTINLGINLERYLRYLIIDITYMKSSEETKKNLNIKIKKQEEEITYYLQLLNYEKEKNKELENQIERIIKNEDNNNNTTN